MQAGSKCKQGVDKAGADALVQAVNKFAAIFWETKGISTKIVIAPYPPALPIVQPILEDA
jgi:nickel superoxide dismutase